MKKMIFVILFAVLAVVLIAEPFYIEVTANRACNVKVKFVNEATGNIETTGTGYYDGSNPLSFSFNGLSQQAYDFIVVGYTPLASDTQYVGGQPYVTVYVDLDVDPFEEPGTPAQ